MTPCSPRAAAVALLLLAACATSPPSAAAAPAPREPVHAFLYEVETLQYARWWGDVPELWLPEFGLCCNASSGEANAFASKAPRNRDRAGAERPTERRELPADVVDDIVALAEITARQRELAARVAARVVPLVPLDASYEIERLYDEMRTARATRASAATLDEIQQRFDRIRDGTLRDHRARRVHELREEIGAAVNAR